MTIEQRELAPGTKLVGTYKRMQHVCEVIESEEGKRRYRLEDGRVFSSPSSAAKAVMAGISANGWRFWRVEGTGPENASRTEQATGQAKAVKRLRQSRKLPNQKGVEEGEVRWFCSGCMKSFLMPTGEAPAACPEGHPREVEDDLPSA